MLLELCVYNIQSALIAQQHGAQRIELCADPKSGGITPSYGTIQHAVAHLTIPIYCMVRPRGGNFVYDDDEKEIMKKDILQCKELGCRGIATGAQLPTGELDVEFMKRMVEWAYPMGVTCHKVFDVTANAMTSLDAVLATGCERILTSGLQPTAMAGSATLAELRAQANGRITIMAGGSVRSTNLQQLIAATGLTEYHSSALISKTDTYIADAHEVQQLVVQCK
jgi:copper homeostasis protein